MWEKGKGSEYFLNALYSSYLSSANTAKRKRESS